MHPENGPVHHFFLSGNITTGVKVEINAAGGKRRCRGRRARAWEARTAAWLHVATPLSRGAAERAPGEPDRAEH